MVQNTILNELKFKIFMVARACFQLPYLLATIGLLSFMTVHKKPASQY